MSEMRLEYNGGYLVTQIRELEKENIRLSKLNKKYKQHMQIGLPSEPVLLRACDLLETINKHCDFLKTSGLTNSVIEKHILNIQNMLTKTIEIMMTNIDRYQTIPESSLKKLVD